MPATAFVIHRIACVGNTAQAPDIVRMKNIQPRNRAVIISHAAIALLREKLFSAFRIKIFFLRKSNTLFYNLVSNANHCGNIVIPVFSDFDIAPL